MCLGYFFVKTRSVMRVEFTGQLGRKIPERRMINSTRPDPLHLRKVIAVGSGAYHSFAIDAEGEVYAWGLNQYGQLGLEPEVDASGEESRIVWTPAHIPELSPSELSKDGWKDSRVVRISGGEHHTVFLLSDGRVFAAGRIDSSQLGLHSDHPHLKEAKAADRDYISTPTRVLFPPLPREGEPNPDVDPTDEEEETKTKVVKNPISKVSAAGHGSLALSKEGYVYSWGFGGSSQVRLVISNDSSVLNFGFLYSLGLALIPRCRRYPLVSVGKSPTSGSLRTSLQVASTASC